MKYTGGPIPGESFNRFSLMRYYLGRSFKAAERHQFNTARFYARVSAHHALEIMHRQQTNVTRPRRKAEDAWSPRELRALKPGDCFCGVA